MRHRLHTLNNIYLNKYINVIVQSENGYNIVLVFHDYVHYSTISIKLLFKPDVGNFSRKQNIIMFCDYSVDNLASEDNVFPPELNA